MPFAACQGRQPQERVREGKRGVAAALFSSACSACSERTSLRACRRSPLFSNGVFPLTAFAHPGYKAAVGTGSGFPPGGLSAGAFASAGAGSNVESNSTFGSSSTVGTGPPFHLPDSDQRSMSPADGAQLHTYMYHALP